MILNIVDTINEWIEPFQNWINKNHDNPIMWFGLILLGVAIFSITFSSLHRNGE